MLSTKVNRLSDTVTSCSEPALGSRIERNVLRSSLLLSTTHLKTIPMIIQKTTRFWNFNIGRMQRSPGDRVSRRTWICAHSNSRRTIISLPTKFGRRLSRLAMMSSFKRPKRRKYKRRRGRGLMFRRVCQRATRMPQSQMGRMVQTDDVEPDIAQSKIVGVCEEDLVTT
jgi:hypothetical protein